jgi:hypothetical protein
MTGNNVSALWPSTKPDFGRLLKVFRREGLPDRVPFIELFADAEVVAAVVGDKPIDLLTMLSRPEARRGYR